MTRAIPILSVVVALMALWYAAVPLMNAQWERDQAARGGYTLTTPDLIARTMAQERPRLPAPHQVALGLWDGMVGCDAVGRRACRATEPLTLATFPERVAAATTSVRSLLYHAGITLGATALGFAIGTALGLLLAIGIVHNRAMDVSVMPFAIASQTIPIIALAPMIIVVLNSVGVAGVVPKSIIAAYLSFFPVAVGMVAGLRAPDRAQLDQMKTWNASGWQTFWRLRLPASVPFLFASMKVAVAAALVGTIVGELPVQQGGLGVRLLSASYYGQTVQMWAALLTAAILAASLVALVGLAQRTTAWAMGARG